MASSPVEREGIARSPSESDGRTDGFAASCALDSNVAVSKLSAAAGKATGAPRFAQEAVQLVNGFLAQLERRQRPPHGEARSSGATDDDCQDALASVPKEVSPTDPEIVSALHQLVNDLRALCAKAEEQPSSSGASAMRSGEWSPHSVVTQLLSSSTPLPRFEQRRLLSAAAAAKSNLQSAAAASRRGGAPGGATAPRTCEGEGEAPLCRQMASAASLAAQPSAGGSSGSLEVHDKTRRRPAAGPVRTEAEGKPSLGATRGSAVSGEHSRVRVSRALLRDARETAVGCSDAATPPSVRASLRARTLTAAAAVSLCQQSAAHCSARYVPKLKRDSSQRRGAGGGLSATTRVSPSALRAASSGGCSGNEIFYEGAHLPQFDDCDEYRDDADFGYRVLDIPEDDFCREYCGPAKDHPLARFQEPPAVDLHSAQLALACVDGGNCLPTPVAVGEGRGAVQVLRGNGGAEGSSCSAAERSPLECVGTAKESERISSADSRTPSPSFGAAADAGAAVDGCCERGLEGGEASPPPQQRPLHLAARLPTFGTGDEHAAMLVKASPSDHRAEEAAPRAVGPSTKSCTSGEAGRAQPDAASENGTPSMVRAVSAEDELADCTVQLREQPTESQEGQQDYEQQHKHNMERAAYEAARLWKETYCEGNVGLFRKRQAKLAAEALHFATYPHSGDKLYPIECADSKYDCFNLKVVFSRNATGTTDYAGRSFPPGTLVGGRYEVEFEVVNNEKAYVDQSMDEVAVLRLLQANGDPDEFHFIRLKDFMYFLGNLVIVTELLDENLYAFNCEIKHQRQPPFWTLGRIQRVMKDILLSLRFVHGLHIIHGDLKPENILCRFTNQISHAQQLLREQHSPDDSWSMTEDTKCVPTSVFSQSMLSKFGVKVIDFGNSCFTCDKLWLYMQSRSYRAPEVFLELPYDTKIDIWSLGCIAYELWTGEMLFECDTVAAHLAKLVGILGPIPFYMVRCSPLRHTLFDSEGFLYEFSDSRKKQQQQQHSGGPSVGLYREDREDTLLNSIDRFVSEQRLETNSNGAGEAADERRQSQRNGSRRLVRFFAPKKTSLYQRMRCLDPVFVEFISKMLQFDPCKRWSADMLLSHPFLDPGRYPDGL